MMELFDAGNLLCDEIILSDEAHFWLNGYVNKQNIRFWGKRKFLHIWSETFASH